MKLNREQRTLCVVFLAPALGLFVGFVAWPGIRALLYSLQKWNGLSQPEWTGLANFRALFEDALFYNAFKNNLLLTGAAGSITICLALFFASLLHRRVRGAGLFRVAFFFPNIIASVAVALLWVLLYNTTDFGVVNGLLALVDRALVAVGIQALEGRLPFSFTDSRYLIYSLIPMMVWTATGFYMVLFLAAMEGIPEEYYEAAVLDGASGFSQFIHLTLPMIREVLIVGVVFFVISSAKIFDTIWVMENQYPTEESHVLATVLYQKVFSELNVGHGAAVAVMLFLIVFVATLFVLRLQRREALEF